jgi:hypothetical protein
MIGKIYLPPPPSLRDQVAGVLLSLRPARSAPPVRLRLTRMAGRPAPSRPLRRTA